MKEDPPLDFKCKDKFLVQSFPVDAAFDPDDLPPGADLWSVAEQKKKGDVAETKLRVVFLPAGNVAAPSNSAVTAQPVSSVPSSAPASAPAVFEPSPLVTQPSAVSVEVC